MNNTSIDEHNTCKSITKVYSLYYNTHTLANLYSMITIVSVGCWLIKVDLAVSIVCHQYCPIVADLNI